MVNIRFVWIGGKQYWHYEDADTIEQLMAVAKYMKKTEGCKYWIIKGENKYHLFLTKIRKVLA